MIPGLSLFGKAGVTAAQLLLSPACTLCKPVPCCHSWLMRPTDQLPSSTTQWKCPSFIFSTRNYSHWGTEALSAAELQAGFPAGVTSGCRPACALGWALSTQVDSFLDKYRSYLCYDCRDGFLSQVFAGLLDLQNPGLRGSKVKNP